MFVFNLNTKEILSFDVVSEYLHRNHFNFWKSTLKDTGIGIDSYINLSNNRLKHNFKIILCVKEYMKLSILVEEPFSKVFYYNSIYLCNYKDNKNLIIRDLLTDVELNFFKDTNPELLDFILYKNLIVKYNFPNPFYIPEDELLEVDFLVFGFLKNFFERDKKNLNNREFQLLGG